MQPSVPLMEPQTATCGDCGRWTHHLGPLEVTRKEYFDFSVDEYVASLLRALVWLVPLRLISEERCTGEKPFFFRVGQMLPGGREMSSGSSLPPGLHCRRWFTHEPSFSEATNRKHIGFPGIKGPSHFRLILPWSHHVCSSHSTEPELSKSHKSLDYLSVIFNVSI